MGAFVQMGASPPCYYTVVQYHLCHLVGVARGHLLESCSSHFACAENSTPRQKISSAKYSHSPLQFRSCCRTSASEQTARHSSRLQSVSEPKRAVAVHTNLDQLGCSRIFLRSCSRARPARAWSCVSKAGPTHISPVSGEVQDCFSPTHTEMQHLQ